MPSRSPVFIEELLAIVESASPSISILEPPITTLSPH